MKLLAWREQEGWFTHNSVAHFLFGFCWGRYTPYGLCTLVLVHSLFEYVENVPAGIKFFQILGWREYGGDAPENILGDTVSAILGSCCGQAVRRRTNVASQDVNMHCAKPGSTV